MHQRKCKGLNRYGKPCGTNALPGSDYCGVAVHALQLKTQMSKRSTVKSSIINNSKKIMAGIVLIVTVSAGIFGYLEVIHPYVSLSIEPSRDNILISDFIFTNESYFFTLIDTMATMYFINVDLVGDITAKNVGFQDIINEIGDIEPRGNSTTNLTISQMQVLKRLVYV